MDLNVRAARLPRAPNTLAVLPRRRAELAAERVVEARDVTKPAAHGDVDHARIMRREAYGRSTQPCSHHIAVRREAGDAGERAHEMKDAEIGFLGEQIEPERRRRIVLDQVNGTSDGALRTCRVARRSV